MNRQNKETDICAGPLFGKIIRYTIPLILMNIFQLLYNAADMVIVGRCYGELPVAAIGATATVIQLIVNTCIGLSTGVNVCISHDIGAKKEGAVSETVTASAVLGVISGLVVTTVGIVTSAPLLALMNTPENIMDMSLLYIRVYYLGAPASLLYNYLAAVLRAKGDTKKPLYILVASGAVNVILNIVFVVGFHMHVLGVAIATVLSQYLSAVLLVILLLRERGMCRLRIIPLRFHGKSLARILRFGLPAGMQSSVFALSTLIIQSAINSFGSSAIAGNTAAGNLDTFSYIAFNAFQITAVTFVAQNCGAGNIRRVERSFRICLLSAVILAIVTGWTIYFLAEPLLGIYLPGQDEAIACGTIRLKYICLPYFLLAMMDVTAGALRGLGSSLLPTVLSVIGSCGLRLLWIFTVFEHNRSLDVLYLSFPLAWLATFIALLLAYFFVKRKKSRAFSLPLR